MKLTELQPRWLIDEGAGGRRWFLFRSPAGHGDFITCKTFPLSVRDQMEKLYELASDLRGTPVAPCREDMCWTVQGDFDRLTVSPSLDFSASGNWHGFIRDGLIVGGL